MIGFLWQSLRSLINATHKPPINVIAQCGAILVSVTVPLNCLEKEVLCSNMLFFKTHSANSIRESVETVLSSRASNAFHIATNQSSWGILG